MKIILKGGPFNGREVTTSETDVFFTLDGQRYEDTGETDQERRRVFPYAPRSSQNEDVTVTGPDPTSIGPAFPRLWSLLAFLLPRKARAEAYEPAHQELLEDYLVARKLYRTKWARRWLTFCFMLRTVVMVAQSLRAWLGDKRIRALKWLMLAVLGAGTLRNLRGMLFDLFRKL
jgi:hypothetical protein